MSLTPGQTLHDTYTVVRLIGIGGMGEVYEVRHARLAGRYAIKLLLAGIATNVEALARFQREAEVTSSLRHPNIVQVVDFNKTTDGVPYLVMELLEGESLGARLARLGSLPLPMAVSIIEQA